VKAKSVELAKKLTEKLLADSKSSGKSFADVLSTTKWVDVFSWKAPAIGTFTILPAAITADDAGAPKGDISDAGTGDGGAKPALVTLKVTSPDEDDAKPKGETSGAVNRGGDPVEGLAPDLAAKVMTFAFSAKEGEFMPEPMRSGDDFVLVKLKEQKAATREEFDKDRETYMAGMLRGKQAEALAIYVRRLRDAAKDDLKIDVARTNEQDGGVPAQPVEDDEGE